MRGERASSQSKRSSSVRAPDFCGERRLEHRAHARRAVGERNDPVPDALIDRQQDVARPVPLGPADPVVVREERRALQLRVEPARAELAREKGPLSRGVHDGARPDLALLPVLRRGHHADGPPAFEEHVRDRRLLPDVGAALRRVLEQQVVEVRALDLVRHRVPVVEGVLEDDGPRPALLEHVVPEERPVLLLKPRLPDLLEDAQPLEDRQAVGQERLADVEAGEPLLLQHDDAPARAREERRDGGAGGPAADHDRVVD